MRTFWRQAKRIGPAAGRRGGLLALVPVLLLCAWLMPGTAYAAKPAEPTYLFEVTTGMRTASGDEDKIDFFIITYTTEGSGDRTISKFLFPSKNAWTQTYEMATAANNSQAERDRMIRSTYGYAGADLKVGKKLFQSYSTDQYLFTTPEKIKEIKRVQVFASDSGSWACKGMRVFRVDDLGGLYRWNDAANECYIDFEGDLIAEGTMRMDMNISWANDRLVGTKAPEEATGATIALKTSGFDAAYAHHKPQSNQNKTLALRFDFADVYGAGLETNAALSATNNTLATMGLAENMAMTLYYKDIYGMKRAANVPVVLNAATYAAQLVDGAMNKPIAGFAQQGEGIACSVFLPDFASLSQSDGFVLTLGDAEARAVLGLSEVKGSLSVAAGHLHTERVDISKTDTASLITMAIYELGGSDASGEQSVRVSASFNEASGVIRYTYIGDPTYYQPVSTVSGVPLRIGTNRLSLSQYEHGKLLAPRDRTERYLFEITTDDAGGAGTKSEILMRVSYTDLNGSAKSTETINIREMSRDFNGWWKGSTAQDIAYYKGVATGQTLRFFVPMSDVKTIENVEVWIADGGDSDDWQMSDLCISSVSAFDRRTVTWKSFSADGVSCELFLDRTVEATELYRYQDTTEGPVLIQQGADQSTEVGPSRANINDGGGAAGADGMGVDVTKAKSVDWSEIRYSMSFRQASQELGFTKQRYVYAVTVNVGGDSEANAESGDCGSKNLFYFRLIFQSGSSGFVLANQQIASDGFIAGASQTFYISTNQDYGDVTAVQIIPEDNSEKSDVFDKLMIDSIEVKRQSNAALVPVWTINNVGWISIDYRDEAQMQSVKGMTGRDASEMTRSYTVDGNTFDVNFMIALQTQGYAVSEGFPNGGPQFEGNISAQVYYDSYSPSKGFEEISDVTKSMYSYMNRTPSTSDRVGGRTISDPKLMHRAGHTDRFYFSLSDVRSIKSIDFFITSAVNTRWDISNVSLFMVNGEGTLALNKNGEYERIYRTGEELTELAHGTSENAPAYWQQLQAYDAGYNKEEIYIHVDFTENEIPISPEAKQWKSIVSREPVSENDTLNLFVYPQSGARFDSSNGPVASLLYTDASDQAQQVSSGDMSVGVYNDQTVFYATGINVRRFGVLNPSGVVLYSGRGAGIQGDVRAVMQQVRSGVVIRSWDLAGTGTTETLGIVLGDRAVTTVPQQHVQLQLGADTPAKVLTPLTARGTSGADDLAVAIYYRADDPSGVELRSPFVYLTDQGYTQTKPGQVIDLNFDQKNVAEITGVVIASTGDVSATVDAARVINREIDINNAAVVEIKGEYSAVDKITVMNAAYRMSIDAEHTVKPLQLTFATALSAAGDVSAGTGGPVRMNLAYYDTIGDLITKSYDDIRPYIIDGSTGFLAGSTVNVEILVSDAVDLRWIELEPYDDVEESSAMWTLESVTATLGEGEGKFTKHCGVNQQIVEGTPVHLNLADILVTAQVSTGGSGETQNVESGSLDLLIPSGETIWIFPKVTGSYDGFTATLAKVDTTTGAVGKASLDDTRGYTAESIAEKAEAASDSREKSIWNAAQPQPGVFEASVDRIEFIPPRNYTDKSVQYQIKIVSIESAASSLTINVTVERENDPVAQQLDALNKLLEQERLERMQQQIDDLNRRQGEENEPDASAESGGGESGGAGE